MAQFKLIYYIILAMLLLLIMVFLWGAITYFRVKKYMNNKFLNRPLFATTLSIAIIGFGLALVPIGLEIWTYDDEFIKSDPLFLSILILEFIFLVTFLILAYTFAYDFGIAIDQNENRLQFFGQRVNINRVIALVERRFSIKIVYEQGHKNLKKRVTIFTPGSKGFARRALAGIVSTNQKGRSLSFDSLNMVTKEAGTTAITRFSKETVKDREL